MKRWQFWIDRGGTFTDCIAVSPEGHRTSTKVLSSDRAPLAGIRKLLALAPNAAIPACDIRMGTTLATNALLERQGTKTALIITEGFRDLLAIGNQTRPDLFNLDIVKPDMLYEAVVEVPARLSSDGEVLARPDPVTLRKQLKALGDAGITSLAVVVLHAYKNPELERLIAGVAAEQGWTDVSISHEVSGEMGMLSRGDTTVVDAYLTPLIRRYLRELCKELPGSRLQIMQSSGGLTSVDCFHGKDAVLSGPAGGVIAYTEIAKQSGFDRVIGFDMGGTSTDVSCFDGELERSYEAEIAGIRLRAPMLSIHTVAAGGGSICQDNGFRLTVGPDSAGSHPGPICYGEASAQSLTVTDCNLLLGRIVDDRFPFRLYRESAQRQLDALAIRLGQRGIKLAPLDIAAGFVEIANANMATALREVTISRGRDLREFVMVVFGGAGAQHACAVGRQLGVRSLLIDEQSGVLSAYGMGLAVLAWHGQADAGRRLLGKICELEEVFAELEEQGARLLREQGGATVVSTRRVDLRYRGTDAALTIRCGDHTKDDFRTQHERAYGYNKDGAIEIVTLRVELASRTESAELAVTPPSQPIHPLPPPLRTHEQWVAGRMVAVPVYGREQLAGAEPVMGPALIVDDSATLCLDEGWTASMQAGRRLLVHDTRPQVAKPSGHDGGVDPIRLEIFNNLFMSTAMQMGTVLRDTSMSTNIRERLDFSCAVFDADGGLVANAPHIPVHLGAMAESIRGILSLHPTPRPGSVYAVNDPNLGGSHLPDITVVTPIHDEQGQLIFFTASRGHHGDVGGSTPGSMPPFSKRLTEEGVVLRGIEIVRDGIFAEAQVVAALSSGVYPPRCPLENLADLKAQVSANRCGVNLLHEMLSRYGVEVVLAYMGHVQDNAAEQVAESIAAIADGDYRFADSLDDGTRIEVCVRVSGRSLIVDFEGTSPQSEGNLNAPTAVSIAAIMYVLRCMVGEQIPLNSGCLRNVEVKFPAHSILDPDPGRAVVAGNVETSQRIVDVLVASLGLAAASQGTMNNLTFGDDSFGYYETIAGGAGATSRAPGADGVHTHMTNTRITDPEILESRYPVRLVTFAVRRGSGGRGYHRGGDGLVREIEALRPLRVSIISERRSCAPFGLHEGGDGKPGRNLINGEIVPGSVSLNVRSGDRIRIETPGGGGYGAK
ncbi:MAG: hydantoinase B/oxoprolinase family protein [Nannocystaceae bacterium]